MRILKVTQAYYPFQERGGPAVKVRSIARLLVRLGNKVTVLTADLGFRPANINAAGISRTERGWRAERDGVEAVYLRTLFHYRNLTVNPGIVGFCRERLRDFELVHIYGLYDVLGPAVASFCRRFMIPYFVEPLGMTRPIDRGFLLKKLWWRLFCGYLPGASRIVATSELERSELLEDHFEASRVLLRYNGIDLKEFGRLPAEGSFRKKAGFAEDEKFVLFLGRIIPRKGADLLIEALAQIGCEKLKLVLAGPEGESGYVALLRAKARAVGVERRVLFVGPLYGEEKNAALADAWIFALPSRYENFGNTAAEAIACGTPAVVSERCGIAPLIRQAAGLVVSYDAGSLARSLGALLRDDALYQQLKAGCRSVAERISWDHLVPEMQDSYECARDHFLRRSPV